MKLRVFGETFALARLPGNAAVPDWVAGSELIALVRTARELSIVCRDDAVPREVSEVERGFRAIVVTGTLDFTVTGVIAALADPLAAAGIPIFGLSTYDTDHILVRESLLPAAVEALRAAGHEVSGEPADTR
ncbi:MAG TPA: ACT domain-containing protein [Candidatus Baltobacteraceae bacterium]|nr:ACT domain-containing protein [Candidatus Baltobacteraceae bacterium]